MKKKLMGVLFAVSIACTAVPATGFACTGWVQKDANVVCKTPLCNGKDRTKYREKFYQRTCTTTAGKKYTESKTTYDDLGCCYNKKLKPILRKSLYDFRHPACLVSR